MRYGASFRGAGEPRRARCLFAGEDRLGQSREVAEHERPIWGGCRFRRADYAEAAIYGEEIRADLARQAALWCWSGDFDTQSVDPVFLDRIADSPGTTQAQEPRARAWRAVAYEIAEPVAFMLGKAQAAYKPARIDAQFAYMGGGFGGRDHTPFRSMWRCRRCSSRAGRSGSRNAIEQFQCGNQAARLPMHSADGRRSGHRQDLRFCRRPCACMAAAWRIFRPRGDGRSQRGASASTMFPKSTSPRLRCIRARVTAGSMRGYGTLQTMTALEVLVDETARLAARPDRIPTAQRAQGGRPDDGGKYIQRLGAHAGDPGQAGAACDLARARAREGARREPGMSTAPASLATKDTARSGLSPGRRELSREDDVGIHAITRDGQRHRDGGGEPGRRYLGGVADEVAVAQVDAFAALALVTSGDPTRSYR